MTKQSRVCALGSDGRGAHTQLLKGFTLVQRVPVRNPLHLHPGGRSEMDMSAAQTHANEMKSGQQHPHMQRLGDPGLLRDPPIRAAVP